MGNMRTMKYTYVLSIGLTVCFFNMGHLSGFLVIGHRGACGHEPENTIASFEKAIALGVDVVECDVRRCASGEVIVFHDNKLDRITNGTGYIEKKTLHELKQLVIAQDQQIATLREILDSVNRRVVVNIELKDLHTVVLVAKIIKEYVQERGWSYDDFIVTSFNHHYIRDFKQWCPLVRVGVILAGIPINFGACGDHVGADIMVLFVDSINQEFVDDIHARGMQVFVFTVNDFDEARRIKNLGVEGIISNYPDQVKMH